MTSKILYDYYYYEHTQTLYLLLLVIIYTFYNPHWQQDMIYIRVTGNELIGIYLYCNVEQV